MDPFVHGLTLSTYSNYGMHTLFMALNAISKVSKIDENRGKYEVLMNVHIRWINMLAL